MDIAEVEAPWNPPPSLRALLGDASIDEAIDKAVEACRLSDQ